MYPAVFHKLQPDISSRICAHIRPSATSSLLLLSICSIRSLFLGSNYAVTQGAIIFERLNKAILASVSKDPAPLLVFCPFAYRCKWEKYLLSGKGKALAMTQAALIGQTFSMLSGVGSIEFLMMNVIELDTNLTSSIRGRSRETC